MKEVNSVERGNHIYYNPSYLKRQGVRPIARLVNRFTGISIYYQELTTNNDDYDTDWQQALYPTVIKQPSEQTPNQIPDHESIDNNTTSRLGKFAIGASGGALGSAAALATMHYFGMELPIPPGAFVMGAAFSTGTTVLITK